MTDLFGGFFDDVSDFLGTAKDDLDTVWDTASDFLGLNKGGSSSGGGTGKVELPAPPAIPKLEDAPGAIGREVMAAAKSQPVASTDPGELYKYWRKHLSDIKANVMSTR